MSSFARGMQLGQQAWNTAEDHRVRQEELAMKKAADARDAEMHGLRAGALRREEAKQAQLGEITADTTAFMRGVDRRATNANLDADFEQAFQATGMGLQAPAMMGGSNAANEAALTARHNLDPNSLKYQLGLNQLAQRYATVSGDMDKVTALAGQGRALSFQDAMNASRQEFVSMTPEQRSAFLESVTENAGIPLNVVPSQSKTKDGKPEYVVWVEGKPRIRVDDATLSDIFAAGKNLGTYGDLARDFMSKGNDKIRQLFKDYVEVTDKTMDTTNQAVRFRNADENDAARTKIAQQQANQTGEYYRGLVSARNKAEGQSAAATALENKINGVMEGYQAAMAAGPEGAKAAAIYAREYDQLRATAGQQGLKVPPSIASMVAAQKGEGPAKLEQVVPEGELRRQGTQLVISDGLGNWIPADANGRPVGVVPSNRTAALIKAGVPENLVSQLAWNQDGTAVGFRNRRYDVSKPADMQALLEDYKRLGANDIAVDEAQKRSFQLHGAMRNQREMREAPPAPVSTSGLGPRITYRPDPFAPAPGAGDVAWEAYRYYQNR